MSEELSEKILTKVSKLFFRGSTMKFLSLILDYSKTGDINHIHKALSFVSGSLVGYNMTLSEDNFNAQKLLRTLLSEGVDSGLALALRLFMEGERGCALWALEDFLEERNTGAGMDKIIDAR